MFNSGKRWDTFVRCTDSIPYIETCTYVSGVNGKKNHVVAGGNYKKEIMPKMPKMTKFPKTILYWNYYYFLIVLYRS